MSGYGTKKKAADVDAYLAAVKAVRKHRCPKCSSPLSDKDDCRRCKMHWVVNRDGEGEWYVVSSELSP